MSGWSNYSCKVKSQKIDENKMGNRESKSVCFTIFKSTIVKEQRVYGSWCINLINSKCTLLGSAVSKTGGWIIAHYGSVRNYQNKILFKQINKIRFYSTSMVNQTQVLIMHPWFLTGFSLPPPGGGLGSHLS